MDNILQREIAALKKEKNAIILAHYYAPAEVQALADYVGDSFALAKKAQSSDADLVVFCGVGFMGESVKTLCPEKTVLMPDITADCPMAHMAQTGRIDEFRRQYDDLAVVCYINSTAALKCHSDVCVTSSNAVRIVRELPNKNIFFIPDQNLGRYVAQQVPEKNIILNDGCCPVHAAVTPEMLRRTMEQHPQAVVLAHPECCQDVLILADCIGSTAELLDFARTSSYEEFIVCTEEGIAYPLQSASPEKKFWFIAGELCCADMKLNTIEKVLHVLRTGENEILLDEETRLGAIKPLRRMLEIAK